MTEDLKDVLGGSSAPAKPTGVVEPKDGDGDDKDKNFANLRKKSSDLETENARLKAELEAAKGSPNLDDAKKKDEDNKSGKDDDPLVKVFKRDVKEAALQWNQKTKVTPEEWSQIQAKVSLNGDETITEIKSKIDEAYHSLPGTRQKRDRELIEKGKKIGMGQIQDDELDLGGSGGDGEFGGGGSPTTLNPKEKNFLKNFGVTPEEQKKIDKEANANTWDEGKSPSRKFFDGGR